MTGQTIYSEKCVTSVITVTILKKDLMFMRSKTLGINVRVTPAEKEKLSENAYYCGLSLSEYLRRLGLGNTRKKRNPPSDKHDRGFPKVDNTRQRF